MNSTQQATRVLVASDSSTEAHQIQRLLKDYFQQISVSVNKDKAVEDFETQKPDILVLAFDNLEKSKQYYLGLYRFGQSLQRHPHRTVLLCGKDEVQAAFDLCTQQYFDDYVLYWPFAQDGLRLPMSIWNASREMTRTRSAGPINAWDAQLDASPVPASDPSPVRGPDPSPVPASDPSPIPAEHARGARPLVLVVDDDEMTRSLLGPTLKAQNCDALYVCDGAEALRELGRVHPDVILMDIGLPDLDGISLTRRLKAAPHLAAVPIIMMTGDSRRETVASSIEAGAVDFIAKPIARASLTAKLGKLLAP